MGRKGSFGAALRAIRVKKNLSQEMLGPSQPFISELERGLRSPTVEKLEQLAAALEISPVTLLAYSHLDEKESVDALLTTVRDELRSLAVSYTHLTLPTILLV